MKENEVYAELTTIRSLMERSAKFISLSGLSAIMAGLYALAGAYFTSRKINTASSDAGLLWQTVLVGMAVLVTSLVTALALTMLKARKRKQRVWNPVSRRFLVNFFIPLLTGGIFIIILLIKAEYSFIAPACLIFYGLGEVSGSQYTFSNVKWLGLSNIVLGLIATFLPEHGLLLWTLGFGFLHIIYGSVMHFKYDR